MLSMTESVQSGFVQALEDIPEPLRQSVESHWQRFCATTDYPWSGSNARDCLRTLPRVWACSEFVARSCSQYPQLLTELIDSGDLQTTYVPDTLMTRISARIESIENESSLKQGLRTFRRRELSRIAWRDLAGWADLSEIMFDLSALADACIDSALSWLYLAAEEKYGTPIGAHSGEPTSMAVLGLGKLGGRELNFSSDVDLMFAYSEPGATTGTRTLSNHEFFLYLGQRLVNVLSEPTEDGIVFRVDMRLRPNGNSGPLALGFEAFEQYYQTHGREWERYALIKARTVAGDRRAGDALLVDLQPFVYRKYLDYGAIEAIREMKAMINRELRRKGMPDNIKLGPGGIREIEFIGQAFQLIRGGRERDLREHSILKALQKLGSAGHLSQPTMTDLNNAYVFLRDTENRLQMFADRQTHELPSGELERLRLSIAMGFSDWASFETRLRYHMDTVQGHFDQLFATPQAEAEEDNDQGLLGVWLESLDTETSNQLLFDSGFDRPEDIHALLRELRAGPAYSAFSSEGRSRMDKVVPLLLASAGSTDKPLATLVQLIKLIESIGRRSAYLVLLLENPDALSQLVRLCAASSWIANWISQHPVLLDELIDPASLYGLATKDTLLSELTERLRQVGEDDLEMQMEVLREFRHGHVLRVAAADVGPGLNPEQVSSQLACIAEVVLQTSLELAYAALVKKHGEPKWKQNESQKPHFAIIAYGKLGSLELGYGSDLDLIFLYDGGGAGTDGPRPIATEVFFARLGQRLIHMLTTRTHAGLLYEVDMRLRPSGKRGPLVTTLPAFRDYQHEHAWTWEHQALVRARAVAGSHDLCRRFVAVRREILCVRRHPEQLRKDVRQMRARMESAQADHDPSLFDIKHDRGGIVDIEFMVQYWILLLAADNPGLTEYTDNISILGALADAGLLDAKRVQLLVKAYRCYLSTEHRLKLAERKALIAHSELSGLPERVTVLWRDLFERDSGAE